MGSPEVKRFGSSGHRPAGEVMPPDHPLYSTATARVAEVAQDARAKAQKGFAARTAKLLAEKDPEKRAALEKAMRSDDARDAEKQRKAKEEAAAKNQRDAAVVGISRARASSR